MIRDIDPLRSEPGRLKFPDFGGEIGRHLPRKVLLESESDVGVDATFFGQFPVVAENKATSQHGEQHISGKYSLSRRHFLRNPPKLTLISTTHRLPAVNGVELLHRIRNEQIIRAVPSTTPKEINHPPRKRENQNIRNREVNLGQHHTRAWYERIVEQQPASGVFRVRL